MKRIAPLFVLLMMCGTVFGSNGNMIQFKSGADQVNAYYSKPAGDGPFPGLIVIHEWWGLNDEIKGIADRFAAQGYVAMAVDLYRGKVATKSDEAHQYMSGLPEDRAIADLKAAFDYLQAQKEVKKQSIGSIGFCMGGGYSLQLAINDPRLAACVMFYGRPVSDVEQLKKIHAPVLGLFGAEDKGIPPEAVHTLEASMKSAGKPIETHIYPGAGHAFFNETGPAYNADAAKDAWSKTIAFFSQHLR